MRSQNEIDETEVLAEIDKLREAVEGREGKAALMPRFMRIADAVKSAAGLSEALIRLGTAVFG